MTMNDDHDWNSSLNFYSVITEENLQLFEKEYLPLALNGDYESICVVLNVIAMAIKQNIPLTEQLSRYLCSSLLKISAGTNPSSSFGIVRKRGEKDVRLTRSRNINHAIFVKELMSRKGLTLDKAVAQVAKENYVSEDSVKSSYIKHHRGIELLDVGAIFPFSNSGVKK